VINISSVENLGRTVFWSILAHIHQYINEVGLLKIKDSDKNILGKTTLQSFSDGSLDSLEVGKYRRLSSIESEEMKSLAAQNLEVVEQTLSGWLWD
jgi:hypothetical protein